MTRHLFTIGHSNHPWERFTALLQKASVTMIADVRSSPYSRFNPQFNRETMAKELKIAGIEYRFVGRELGARSDDPTCYDEGRVCYDRLARTAPFRAGLEQVTGEARSYRIALMCAEKEPLECHRSLLVSSSLVATGVTITHILGDGQLEPHSRMLDRLLELLGLPEKDLFRSKEAMIADALKRQEDRIAYRNPMM